MIPSRGHKKLMMLNDIKMVWSITWMLLENLFEFFLLEEFYIGHFLFKILRSFLFKQIKVSNDYQIVNSLTCVLSGGFLQQNIAIGRMNDDITRKKLHNFKQQKFENEFFCLSFQCSSYKLYQEILFIIWDLLFN